MSLERAEHKLSPGAFDFAAMLLLLSPLTLKGFEYPLMWGIAARYRIVVRQRFR